MIQVGILDGDYVIVKQQATANNGEIVIAMTDENEATCKRFYKEHQHFRLQPGKRSIRAYYSFKCNYFRCRCWFISESILNARKARVFFSLQREQMFV